MTLPIPMACVNRSPSRLDVTERTWGLASNDAGGNDELVLQNIGSDNALERSIKNTAWGFSRNPTWAYWHHHGCASASNRLP